MSIYCSRITVGRDPWESPSTQKGKVFTHPQNNLRLLDLPVWPEGSIHLAHIPAWCVPGHETEEENYDEIAPWLRLSVDAGGGYLDVVLNEDAARALAADLVEWANYPKVGATDD